MNLVCLKHSWFIAAALYIVFSRGFVDIGLLGDSCRLVNHWWVVYRVVWDVVKWLFTGPNQKSPPIFLYDILVSTWDTRPWNHGTILPRKHRCFHLINACIPWIWSYVACQLHSDWNWWSQTSLAIFVWNIHQVVREPSMHLLLRLHLLRT